MAKSDATRCVAITKAGERCKKNARDGNQYCAVHQDYEEVHEHNHSLSENEVEAPLLQSSQHNQTSALVIPPAPSRVQMPSVSRIMSPSPYLAPVLAPAAQAPLVIGIRSASKRSLSKQPTVSSTPSQSNITSATNTTTSSGYTTVENRIEAIEEAIHSLTLELNNKASRTQRKPRQPKPWTNEKAINKAKLLFYHDHKKDEDIVESVRGGLEQGNMLVYKAKKVGDVVTHVPNIHWMLIKDATDMRFEALASLEKDAYVRRAWKEYNDKLAGNQ
jgi:hypothetical protein